jgi:hypothetical protein
MIHFPQGLWNIMQDRICYSFCSCNFQTFQNNISDSRCVDAHNQPIMTDSHHWVCLHHFIQNCRFSRLWKKSLVSFPRPTDLPTTSTLQMRRRWRLQRFWSQGQWWWIKWVGCGGVEVEANFAKVDKDSAKHINSLIQVSHLLFLEENWVWGLYCNWSINCFLSPLGVW